MNKYPARGTGKPSTTRRSRAATPRPTTSYVTRDDTPPSSSKIDAARGEVPHHSFERSTRRTGKGDQSSYTTGNSYRKLYTPDLASGTSTIEEETLFKIEEVEYVAEEVLQEALENTEYDPTECRDISPHLAMRIVERIREFTPNHFKVVCLVNIGSLEQEPAIQFGSRCLWHPDTDKFVSVKFANDYIYAVALIFGLHFD